MPDLRYALVKVPLDPLPAAALMGLHGLVCLALRHPSVRGPTRELGLEFVRATGAKLVEIGLLSPAELELVQRVEAEESRHGGI